MNLKAILLINENLEDKIKSQRDTRAGSFIIPTSIARAENTIIPTRVPLLKIFLSSKVKSKKLKEG